MVSVLMMTKTIEFDYKGGEYTQKIAISGDNLPWRYNCTDTWIKVATSPTLLKIEVYPTYDFKKRESNIEIFDKFDNKIVLHVVQNGYTDLRVECPKSIVLYHTYYDTSDFFNVYLTIYGGSRQEPSCNALKPYITKVWDNSNVYNDFIIRVPKTLSGEYTIEHMDARAFRKYCKENGISYDNSSLKKTLTITQLSTKDVIGEMVINIDDVEYRSGDECVIEINEKEYKQIKIISTRFIRLKSHTEYEVVDTCNVDITKMTRWIECINESGNICMRAKETNMLSPRQCAIRLVNNDNPHQFIDITVVQNTTN